MIENPFIVENNNFRSVLFKVCFRFDITKEEYAFPRLLERMLSGVCKKYPSLDKYRNERINRYILSVSNGYGRTNNTIYYTFSLSVPHEKYLKENVIESALDFLMETIYHPLAKDGKFDEENFNEEFQRIKDDVLRANKLAKNIVSNKVDEEIDNVGFLKENIFNNPSLLDYVSNEKLYEFYKKNIGQTEPLFFVMGDVDKDYITKLLSPYIKSNMYKYILNKPQLLTHNGEIKCIDEEGDYNESILAVAYKVKDVTEEDEAKLYILRNFLSGTVSRILMNNLRTKTGLSYYQDSSVYVKSCLVITTGIPPNKKDEALKQIEKSIEELKDINTIKKYLPEIIKRRKILMEQDKDNKYGIFNEIVFKHWTNDKTEEESHEIVSKFTPEEIIEIANRLELELVYFLRGNNDGK